MNIWLIMPARNQRFPLPAPLDPGGFYKEGDVQRPVLTPVLVDAVTPWQAPKTNQPPATDLVTGEVLAGPDDWGMAPITIPRHGSRPNPVPRHWPANAPLPGAVNVSFYDGHGETVKLERLWQRYWSSIWQPPSKRPGL